MRNLLMVMTVAAVMAACAEMGGTGMDGQMMGADKGESPMQISRQADSGMQTAGEATTGAMMSRTKGMTGDDEGDAMDGMQDPAAPMKTVPMHEGMMAPAGM